MEGKAAIAVVAYAARHYGRWPTANDLARFYGISRATAYRWIRNERKARAEAAGLPRRDGVRRLSGER